MSETEKKNKYYSEKQNKWSQKYQASHIKQVKFNFSLQYDADILTYLDSLPNKQGYIKALVRADIARAKSGEDVSRAKSEEEAPAQKIWYAVQTSPEDDWGTGSYDIDEAKTMARAQLDDYPETLIAVIQEGKNPTCLEEIRDFSD